MPSMWDFMDLSVVPKTIAGVGNVIDAQQQSDEKKSAAVSDALFKLNQQQIEEGRIQAEKDKLATRASIGNSLKSVMGLGTDLSEVDFTGKVTPKDATKSLVDINADTHQAVSVNNYGGAFIRYDHLSNLMENDSFKSLVKEYAPEAIGSVAAMQSIYSKPIPIHLTKEQASIIGWKSDESGAYIPVNFSELRNQKGQASAYEGVQAILAATSAKDKIAVERSLGFDPQKFPIDPGTGMLALNQHEFNAHVYAANDTSRPFPDALARTTGVDAAGDAVDEINAIKASNPVLAFAKADTLIRNNPTLGSDAASIASMLPATDPRKITYQNLDPSKLADSIRSLAFGGSTVQAAINDVRQDPSKVPGLVNGMEPKDRDYVLNWLTSNGVPIPKDINSRLAATSQEQTLKAFSVPVSIQGSEFRIPAAGDTYKTSYDLSKSMGSWDKVLKDDSINAIRLISDDSGFIDPAKAEVQDKMMKTKDPVFAFKQGNVASVFGDNPKRVEAFNRIVTANLAKPSYDPKSEKTVFDVVDQSSRLDDIGGYIKDYYQSNRGRYDSLLSSPNHDTRRFALTDLIQSAGIDQKETALTGLQRASSINLDAFNESGADKSYLPKLAGRNPNAAELMGGMVAKTIQPIVEDRWNKRQGFSTIIQDMPSTITEDNVNDIKINTERLLKLDPQSAAETINKIDTISSMIKDSEEYLHKNAVKPSNVSVNIKDSYLSIPDRKRAVDINTGISALDLYNRLSLNVLRQIREHIMMSSYNESSRQGTLLYQPL